MWKQPARNPIQLIRIVQIPIVVVIDFVEDLLELAAEIAVGVEIVLLICGQQINWTDCEKMKRNENNNVI